MPRFKVFIKSALRVTGLDSHGTAHSIQGKNIPGPNATYVDREEVHFLSCIPALLLLKLSLEMNLNCIGGSDCGLNLNSVKPRPCVSNHVVLPGFDAWPIWNKAPAKEFRREVIFRGGSCVYLIPHLGVKSQLRCLVSFLTRVVCKDRIHLDHRKLVARRAGDAREV